MVQGTDKAIIDWGSFNIGAGEATHFTQPTPNSVTLNRVHSADASTIDGVLTANGNIFIVNQNGVLFGAGSRVDVNGLVVSTADIGNDNFNAGNFKFDRPGNPAATIENRGQITAKDAGLVGIVAPNVLNSGTITAKLGRVHLASGDTATVDLYGDGLMEVAVSDAVSSQRVENTGIINAAGGTIALTAAAGRNVVNSVVKVSGELHAPSVGTHQGTIVIAAEGSNAVAGNVAANKGKKSGVGTVYVDGTLDVSGANAGEVGGKVTITGDHIAVLEQVTIDASGYNGGGIIHVGGQYLGQGDTPTALVTIIQSGAILNASARAEGAGGEVIAYADERTEFAGSIEANGAGEQGDGGFVETSGKGALLALGQVRIIAGRNGKAGTWLLDPADITVTAATNTNITGSPNFTANGTASQVSAASIKTLLDAGTNVTVTTSNDGYAGNGDITVSSAITTTGSGALTLSAYRDVTVNAGITLHGGALTLRANNAGAANGSSGSGSVTINSAIATSGGAITIGGGSGAISGATLNADGSASTAASGYAVGGGGYAYGVKVTASINAGGGNLLINGIGANLSTDNNYGVYLGGGTTQTSGTGTINISGIGGGNTNSSYNYGVAITSTALRHTGTGTTTVSGIAGGAGTGLNSFGLVMGGGTLSNTGGGALLIYGRGGLANGNDIGVRLQTSSNAISSTGGGNITVYGQGGTSGYGIYVTGSSGASAAANAITASGGGNINVTALGTGTYDGLNITYAGSSITNTGGNITIKGNAANTSYYGVNATVAGAISTSTSGNISIYTDRISMANAGTVSAAGSLALASYSNRGISVGTSVASTTNISDTQLGYLSAASYIFGSTTTASGASNTGDVTINTGYDFGTKNVTFISGGNISLASTLTKASGAGTATYLLRANGAITATGGAAITSTSGALNLTLDSDYDTSGGEGISLNGGTFNTNGGNLTLSDATTLTGNTIFTLGAGTLTAPAVSGAYNFTATATAYTLSGNWGGAGALGAVSLTSVNGLSLPSITSSSIFAQTTGATSDISLASGKTLTASGSGTAITLVSGQNFLNSSATPFSLTGGGRWLVYSANPSNDTLSGLTSSFVRYGCTYAGGCPTGVSIPGTGNGIAYSYQPTLTVTPSTQNIVYGNAATTSGYSYTPTGYLTGAAGSDSAADTLTGSLTGTTTYSAGNDVGSYNINYSSGTLASALGYLISYANNATAISVGQRTLTVSLTGAVSKTYDATTTATLTGSNYSLGNVYGTDVLGISNTSGTYDDKTATTGKTVTVTGLTLTGTKAANYTLASSTVNGAVGTINKASLSVTGLTANSKTYDGTTADTLSGTAALSGVIGSDAVTLGGSGTAVFADKNYGIGKAVTVTGYTVSGADAGNYTLSQPGGLTADINKALLTITAVGQSVTYGSSVPTGTVSYSGFATGDNAASLTTQPVVSSVRSGVQDVGTYTNNYTVSGAVSNNYNFAYLSGNLSVTARSLTVYTDNKMKPNVGEAVFTGGNNLLAADAALINWVYAPLGYSSGVQGVYVIGATASDPSGRLANYTRNNSYGNYYVGTSTVESLPAPVLAGFVAVPTYQQYIDVKSFSGGDLTNDSQSSPQRVVISSKDERAFGAYDGTPDLEYSKELLQELKTGQRWASVDL